MQRSAHEDAVAQARHQQVEHVPRNQIAQLKEVQLSPNDRLHENKGGEVATAAPTQLARTNVARVQLFCSFEECCQVSELAPRLFEIAWIQVNWKCRFEPIGMKSSCNCNLFVVVETTTQRPLVQIKTDAGSLRIHLPYGVQLSAEDDLALNGAAVGTLVLDHSLSWNPPPSPSLPPGTLSQLLLCELVTTILLSQEYSVDCSVTYNFVYTVGGTVSSSPRRRKACRQSDTSETMFWTCSTFALSACPCEPSRFSSSSLCFWASTGGAPFGRGSQTSGVVEAKDHVSHG